MSYNFTKLRKELDSLGYFETLSPESVNLVGKLLEDLKTTTCSLQKFIKTAQNAIKAKEDLEESVGPFKIDNKKLTKECNDLHLTHLNYRGQTERDIKELRNKILFLNEENRKLHSENDKLRRNLRDTEIEVMKSGPGSRKTFPSSKSRSNQKSGDDDLIRENLEIRHELNELKSELKDLQCKCNQFEQISDDNSEDFSLFNKECKKKRSMIDYKFPEDKIIRLKSEIQDLIRDKQQLERNLKEAIEKQHEAMKRAIHLAERNKNLEKELRDIDQMAIAVEEECNDTVKNKNQKLNKIEAALKEALLEVQTLEKTIVAIKKEKQDLELNYEILHTEKNRMQEMVEDAVKERKTINEQFTNLKLIENDLNLEIDRLVQESAIQKRKIGELESKLIVAAAAQPKGPGGDVLTSYIIAPAVKEKKGKKGGKKDKKGGKKDKKGGKKGKKGKKEKKGKAKKTTAPVNTPTEADIDKALNDFFPPLDVCLPQCRAPCSIRDVSQQYEEPSCPTRSICICDHANKPPPTCQCNITTTTSRCCLERNTLTEAFINGCVETMCKKHFQDLLKKEMETSQCEIKQKLKKVTDERDYYLVEYHKMINQMCQLQSQNTGTCKNCPKTQQMINFLQHENKMLSQEKTTLMARLESTRNENDLTGKCFKSCCKRVERERDLFKSDVTRLEEECDCLRDNLKTLCETKAREHDTFTQQINEYERRFKKLEGERGELMNSQGTRRAQLGSLEEKNELLRNMLRCTQDDLQAQKILYSQLKTLHDQTDRALLDTQAQLTQVEKELMEANNNSREMLKKQVKNDRCSCDIDLNTMKRQLNKLDMERDDLLNKVDSKTEEIVCLQKELDCRCDVIKELRRENMELKEKLGNITDRATTSGAILQDAENEVTRLQKCLDAAIKKRDNALEINRKLQGELAEITHESATYRSQLTKSQEQINNLKLQSQQYISEVQRAEDLLNKKGVTCQDIKRKNEALALKLMDSSARLDSAEKMLDDQSAIDEIHYLKKKITDLEQKLIRCSSKTCEVQCNICEDRCIEIMTPTRDTDGTLSKYPKSISSTEKIEVTDRKGVSSARISMSSQTKQNTPVGEEEIIVQNTAIDNLMSAPPLSQNVTRNFDVNTITAPRISKKTKCNCLSPSSSESSSRSVGCRNEIAKLKASLTQALMGSLPKTKCRTGKCFPDCQSHNPDKNLCTRKKKKKICSESDSSDSKEKLHICCNNDCNCNEE